MIHFFEINKKYYIEALMSENTIDDHLTIAIQLSNEEPILIIPSTMLSPLRIGKSFLIMQNVLCEVFFVCK